MFFLAWINLPHTYRCHCPDFVSTVVCGQLLPYGIDGTKVRGTIRSESHYDLDELGREDLARIEIWGRFVRVHLAHTECTSTEYH